MNIERYELSTNLGARNHGTLFTIHNNTLMTLDPKFYRLLNVYCEWAHIFGATCSKKVTSSSSLFFLRTELMVPVFKDIVRIC